QVPQPALVRGQRVGAQAHDDLARRGGDADVERPAVRERPRRDLDQAGGEAADDVEGTIGRAGVDDHHLDRGNPFLAVDSGQRIADVARLVPGPDDYRCVQTVLLAAPTPGARVRQGHWRARRARIVALRA